MTTEQSLKGELDQPPPFTMAKFSLRGQSEAMKQKMLNDVFVLDGVALLGQATVIYAEFNTGKTLLTIAMLIESIKAKRIKGENVFYINADDSYKGLVTKNQIAEQYGFHMLAPNQNGFNPDAMQVYMLQMIESKTASGTVIVLDTLKKFTDVMDKKTGTAFMRRAREYVQAGGTLIMLSHTNKHKVDGRPVYGGTNDVPSDADCVFTLSEVSKASTSKQVLFENIKSRGNVDREKGATYMLDAKNYHELLESITFVDSETASKLKAERTVQARREKDKSAIEGITEAINAKVTLKTELIQYVFDNYGVSKSKVIKALDTYASEIWLYKSGAKNERHYYLKPETTALGYSLAKVKSCPPPLKS